MRVEALRGGDCNRPTSQVLQYSDIVSFYFLCHWCLEPTPTIFCRSSEAIWQLRCPPGFHFAANYVGCHNSFNVGGQHMLKNPCKY
ncbi:hypothetical protein BDE02_06G100400 [Populus trichocarpa]|nr:hypothetical protein BDE02_06G100400 [Populus trichocarpa]